MRSPTFRLLVSAACALGCLAGTAAAQPRRPAPPPADKKEPKKDKVFPLKTAWVAVSLNGKSAGSGPERPTFFLDENLRANGFGGCNN